MADRSMQSLGLFDTRLSATPLIGHLGCLASRWIGKCPVIPSEQEQQNEKERKIKSRKQKSCVLLCPSFLHKRSPIDQSIQSCFLSRDQKSHDITWASPRSIWVSPFLMDFLHCGMTTPFTTISTSNEFSFIHIGWCPDGVPLQLLIFR